MPKTKYAEMSPDELDQALQAAPVAYLPLGMLEWHGYHLPVGNDFLKAEAICLRVAERAGGVVLPPFILGVGGGHKAYQWTICYEDVDGIENLVAATFDRLSQMGFRVIVAITGHYPGEQVQMVKRAAARHEQQPGAATVIAMPEYEAYPGPERAGDHAAKWETSILWYLRPELVDLARTEAHPDDPLHGVFGEDPREKASVDLGRRMIDTVVENLAERITAALGR